MTAVKVRKVQIVREPDTCSECPSIDELVKNEGEEYRAENQARINAYAAGHWWYIGIRATCEILIPHDHNGAYSIHAFSSPGIWGVESDSYASDLQGIAQDEFENLCHDLRALGIDTADLQMPTQ